MTIITLIHKYNRSYHRCCVKFIIYIKIYQPLQNYIYVSPSGETNRFTFVSRQLASSALAMSMASATSAAFLVHKIPGKLFGSG